jgi:hypothetical protein
MSRSYGERPSRERPAGKWRGSAGKYRDAIETLFGISVDGIASAAEDRAVADDAAARGEATA